jgi:prepilin-type N-terminal cleavage/methylation domain-containing protein
MRRRAFTLIELLIVVAIIAILAAIAVPNFLEAQIRSKIGRCRADQRSIATGLESYFVDYNNYPFRKAPLSSGSDNYFYLQYVPTLSTPVSYLTTTLLKDPFCSPNVGKRWPPYTIQPGWESTYLYINYSDDWWFYNGICGPSGSDAQPAHKAYCLGSFGPKCVETNVEEWPAVEWYPYYVSWSRPRFDYAAAGADCIYDASNGTKSHGSIGRFGGDVGGGVQTTY